MYHYTHRHRAFTLIELLIVIVIIGLLTGLATTSYVNAQRTARDNARKSGVASISTAVETYYLAKRTFPGLVGNEGSGVPTTAGASTWLGCLGIQGTSILYYNFPTVVGGSGAQRPCSDTARGSTTGFSSTAYSPYPNWIPGLGEYLNPVPTEKRYADKDGNANVTLSDASGVINSATDATGDDVLANNQARAYVYRRLLGGYMVYTKMEVSSSGNTAAATYSDAPNTPAGSFTVSGPGIFMIRK
jgi:prepilin-type N-terminal cleavage/methylation domain-containing protein